MSVEKCMISGNKGVVARGRWMAGYTVKGHSVFWSAVIVYDPLHFMETSLLDLSFDANWCMRSSGAEAYGQEAPQ